MSSLWGVLVRYKTLVVTLSVVFLYSGSVALAAMTYVAPGATTDPAGTPGNYTVGPLLSYGFTATSGHNNEALYIDGSGNVASDPLFYRYSSTGDFGVAGSFATNEMAALNLNSNKQQASLMYQNTVTGERAQYSAGGGGSIGLEASYEDGGNMLNTFDMNANATTLTWDPDTTDGVTTKIIQSQNGSAFAVPGTFLLWDDTAANIEGAIGVADTTALGGTPGTAAMTSRNTATGNIASWNTTYDPGLGEADASGSAQNGSTIAVIDLNSTHSNFVFSNDGGSTYSLVQAEASKSYMGVNTGIALYQAMINSSGSFKVKDSVLDQHVLEANVSNFHFAVGDLDEAVNKTMLTLDDFSRAITFSYGTGTHDWYTFPVGDGNSGEVLMTDGNGQLSWGIPASSGWSLSGNTGTTYGTNFLGTIDSENLQFRVNNQPSGMIEWQGTSNTGFGYSTLTSIVSGAQNAAFGISALQNNQNGLFNSAIGAFSLFSNTDGDENTAVGAYSLYSNLADYNVAVGRSALTTNTTGSSNTAIGHQAGYSITSGSNNTLVGFHAGYNQQTASNNIAIGREALFGSGTLANNTGAYNIAVGYHSGYANSTGNYNLFAGYNAGSVNDIGYENVFLGYQSGSNNSNGGQNTFIGPSSGYANTSGSNNVFVGNGAGNDNNSGFFNTYLGSQAGNHTTSGWENTAVGTYAGAANTTGKTNIYVGYQAGANVTTGSSNIIIGHDINAPSATTDGQLSIGNLIFGTNVDGTGTTISTGNVGIGLNNPSYRLDVKANSGDDVARFQGSTGSVACTLSGANGIINCSSDQRLKKDITSLDTTTLGKILLLNPVTYHWNQEDSSVAPHAGFIAQEVQQVFPELVGTDKDTGYLTLSTVGMTPYIVEAIKEINMKIKPLEDLLSQENSFADLLRTFFATAENGIGDFFASRGMFKESICVDGECLTKDDIHALLLQARGGTTVTTTNSGGEEGTNTDSGNTTGTTNGDGGQVTPTDTGGTTGNDTDVTSNDTSSSGDTGISSDTGTTGDTGGASLDGGEVSS